MVLVDGYEIDATVSEQHAYENDVTAFPIERGADVTDHVRLRPVRLSLEGIVSDTPIGVLAGRRQESADRASRPSLDAFDFFKELRARREPVSIETHLGTYDDMLCESLSPSVDAATGAALRFSVSFVQAHIVRTERSTVRVSIPAARAKVNLGQRKAPEAASAAPFDPRTHIKANAAEIDKLNKAATAAGPQSLRAVPTTGGTALIDQTAFEPGGMSRSGVRRVPWGA